MNQTHKFKAMFLQGTSLLLFFSLSFGVLAASMGVFDREADTTTLPGISGPGGLLSPPTTSGTTSPNSPDTDEIPPNAEFVTNLSKTFNPNLIEGYVTNRATVSLSTRVELYNRLTADILEADKTAVLATYESYDSALYQINRKKLLDYEYISGTETVTQYTKQYNAQDSSYITVATPQLVGRKTVQPYMGYLLISSEVNGKTVIGLYTAEGTVLVANLNGLTPYFARDFSNNPIFQNQNGNLYAFNGTKLVLIEEKNIRSNLYYDYPAYPLGTYKNTYEARYNPQENNYDYVNYKTMSQYYSGNFFKAFNYSADGYAVVIDDTENTLRIINYRDRNVFKPGSQYIYYKDINTGKNHYGKDHYAFPDTYGIESIGAQGFDHGYLRLRIRTTSVMSDSLGKVVRDQDYLVDTSGKKFEIPTGYTLEGYSDGVLLLSRDGLYGYYSIEGEWIAQPIYSYARPFIQGLAVVGSQDGTVGMIDTKGNIVLPFVFTSISDVSSGVIVTYCEGIGWEVFTVNKK